MTRKGSPTDNPQYYQCPCCEITKCLETKEYPPGELPTVEEIADQRFNLITKDSSGNHSTNGKVENTKLSDSTVVTKTTSRDFIPVEIFDEPEKPNDRGVVKTEEDSEYVSLNVHMLKRAKSDGRIKHYKQKPNCYFGRRDIGRMSNFVFRRRTDSAETIRTSARGETGITENPVFFSSIGEWTIVDLNLEAFERENANRTFYLRMKRTAYKEEEPENVCIIL